MPVGDVERAVGAAAAADGIELVPMSHVPWLTTRGHLAVSGVPQGVLDRLALAFAALGGDAEAQAAKQLRPLPNDLVHLPTRTMVEVDELQHFTSFRLQTLRYLDDRSTLDHAGYASLCGTWAVKADAYRASKAAKGFPGACSRGRQRAYNDLLRDLLAPEHGWGLVRVPAARIDGATAYELAREAIRRVLDERRDS
ncbi:DUF7255 family protein [Agrococcus lahaulensis]|uniref:DUF7255 family protein n=1 Tax=Agrococcus lahaulensis TaxID=341722 RepID=UPI000554A2E0|nr:hypothetical protein [Agrococcus lahaulensis]